MKVQVNRIEVTMTLPDGTMVSCVRHEGGPWVIESFFTTITAEQTQLARHVLDISVRRALL